MLREDLYTLIVDTAKLSEAHRTELKTKRGFSDEIINQFCFRSGGSYLQTEARLAHIPEDVSASLFYDNVLIPYQNIDGKIYHLKPHKFGFKNASIEVFIPYHLIPTENPRLVLAESEFKAIASCIMGVPSIGIPGIASFSRKHVQKLMDVLEAMKCKEVVICFDNEIKDDPNFPNFKPDFTRRYDSQIYSYIMAALFKSKNIDSKIAILKDVWRVQGKADIDGVLAQGIAHEDYRACIDAAVDASEYRTSWKLPVQHRTYVERRIDRYFYGGPIQESFKCYKMLLPKGHIKKLTNFTITILHTLYSASGAERYCQLESSYGTSSQVIITPEIMVSKVAFQKFCFELGDFEFYGTDIELGQMWSYVIMNQDGRSVRKLKSFGFDDQSYIWFFHNAAYWNGQFCPANEEGIVWVDDVGYLLPQLSGGSEKERENLMVPSLDPLEKKITLEEIAAQFGKIFDENFSRIILGWTLGNFFMPEILKTFKVYPFLFFYGKQQSGKSTLATWVSSFFGFVQQGIPYSPSSIAGISRAVAQLSMIPVWLEEYRNKDPMLAGKNNMLRSIYDKSTIVKGTKREDEIKTYRARSTLMISGEEYPQDAALNSRCMLIPVYRHNYANTDAYYWMMQNCPMFNQIGHDILIKKNEWWPKIKKRVQEYVEAFEVGLYDADSRSRIHHAVIAGVVDTFIGRLQTFESFLCQNVMERTTNVDRSQAINVFLEDLVAMYGSDRLNKTQIIRRVLTNEDKGKVQRVAFWLSGAYALWEVLFKGQRNDIPASKNTLLEHMKSEEYFVALKYVRINNKVQQCLLLTEDHADFPVQLRMILASEDEELSQAPWKPDTYDNLASIERPSQQFTLNDNVLPLARRDNPGSTPIGEKPLPDRENPKGEVNPF